VASIATGAQDAVKAGVNVVIGGGNQQSAGGQFGGLGGGNQSNW
jgi:hypothetical protein